MGDPRVLLDQANQLRQRGDVSGAVAVLRDGLAGHPDLAAGWNMLGILQLESGDPGEAAVSIQRAFDLDPNPALLVNLARAQRASGDRARELETLNRALSIEP